MMRSLYSAVSGIKNHQTRMDVIGNNVANVNTIGYKKSSVQFKDQYSQTLSAASGPTNATGGSNPKQVGLGVTLGSISTNHARGSIQYTGGTLDMAIDGDGYFIVKNVQGGEYYTRAGDFTLNKNYELIDSNGDYVQCIATAYDATKKGYTPSTTTDAQGNAVYEVLADGRLTIDASLFSSVTVTDSGAIVGIASKDIASSVMQEGGTGKNTPKVKNTVPDIKEGDSVVLGYVQIASFANAAGLEKVGNNLYRTSDNSGSAAKAVAGANGRGMIAPSALEMSNVDLSEEMVNMIVTQRGLQANSRVITTTDSILEELVNLKR